jgi:hypothetical protein
VSEHRSLAEACKRIPNGVICLLSALRFHERTTQSPLEVWLAIGEKAWRPPRGVPPCALFVSLRQHSVPEWRNTGSTG